MKTTTSQTRINGSAARATKQVPNKPEAAPRAIASLTLVDHRDTSAKWLALTEFTITELEGIKTSAARGGESVAQFLESAIKQKLASNAAKPNHSDLNYLIPGCDQCEDGLWASLEGQLYLWDGGLSVKPRAVDLATAREWWTKFHARNPSFAAPFFPEKTDAAEFVMMVCEAENKKREREIPDLETAIMKSVALTTMLTERLEHSDYPLNDDIRRTVDGGLSYLSAETCEYLRDAFYDENKMSRVVERRAA